MLIEPIGVRRNHLVYPPSPQRNALGRFTGRSPSFKRKENSRVSSPNKTKENYNLPNGLKNDLQLKELIKISSKKLAIGNYRVLIAQLARATHLEPNTVRNIFESAGFHPYKFKPPTRRRGSS